MLLRDSLKALLSRLAGVRGRSYWRVVPLRRLKFLFLAVFGLVGMVGCLLDVLALGSKPFVEVFGWTLFTGIMAVVYLIFALRTPRLLLIAIGLHFLLSIPVARLLHYLTADSVAPPVDVGVRFAAGLSLLLSLLACLFFLLFFYREGRHSIRLQTELSLAHGIQHTLVPAIERKSSAWEVYGVSLPSEKVGGDLVDIVPEGDCSALAYVADISGHGLPAGILMGMFKTAARTCLVERPPLSAFLDRINRVLPEVKEPAMYATCACVRLLNDPIDGACHVEFAIAGHPPILYYSASRGTVLQLAEGAAALGLLPSPEFITQKLDARSGDVLLVPTDGVMEVMDAKEQEFGVKRLESLLAEHHDRPLKAIAASIFESTASWGRQIDDQTLLLVRFTAPA